MTVILTLRVWAIWDRDKRLLYLLILAASMIWIPTIAASFFFFQKVKCT